MIPEKEITLAVKQTKIFDVLNTNYLKSTPNFTQNLYKLIPDTCRVSYLFNDFLFNVAISGKVIHKQIPIR